MEERILDFIRAVPKTYFEGIEGACNFTIAKYLGMKQASVRRLTRQLAEQGKLKVVARNYGPYNETLYAVP